MTSRAWWQAGAAMLVVACSLSDVSGGMPSLLPTEWTVDHLSEIDKDQAGWRLDRTLAPLFAAVSFFVAAILSGAWGVQRLLRVARRDLPWIPEFTYGRSLALVLLWGLTFVVVLTMISGARELMTPGAWEKQGWTYRLARGDDANSTGASQDDRERRRVALEKLRFALWQYAATHAGRFPSVDDPSIDASLWEIPGWPGLRFLMVADRAVDSTAGRLLVYEPSLEDEHRWALLTNGFIGSLRTADIHSQLAAGSSAADETR